MKSKIDIPHWTVGLLVTAFFLFITYTGIWDFTGIFEIRAYDLRARLASPKERNPHIELVVISKEDLSEFGPLPWRGDIIAQLIHNLSLAGAKVISFTIPFPGRAGNDYLRALRDLKTSYERLGLVKEGPNLSFYHKLVQAIGELDHDRKLHQAIKEANNVVLPVRFQPSSQERDRKVPEFVQKHAIKSVNAPDSRDQSLLILSVARMEPLARELAQAAAGIGFYNLFPEDGGQVRDQVYVLRYLRDIYFPSLPIAIVKVFYGMDGKDTSLTIGKKIVLRREKPSVVLEIPFTGEKASTLISWSQGPGKVFHQTPISKVLKNEIPTGLFKNKIVIVGTSGPDPRDLFNTPIGKGIPGVDIIANSVENILNQRFLLRPGWTRFIELGVLVLFGVFLCLLLPTMAPGKGATLTVAIAFTYIIAGTVSFLFFKIWIKVAPPVLMIILGGLIIVLLKKFFWTEGLVAKPSAEAGFPEAEEELAREDYRPEPELGGLKLGEELGHGKIGRVYQAVEPKSQGLFAVKTISLGSFPGDAVAEVKTRIVAGVRSAKSLNHPNIVRVLGHGVKGDTLFIVMKYLEGENLDYYIQKDNLLPLKDALAICSQVAEAIQYAHSKGLVHGNIRPSNIILDTTDMVAKVTDFGMANLGSALNTKASPLRGTSLYMSPEQVLGKKVDGRTDIFSLGIVLYQMLCSVHPFGAKDIATTMRKIVKEDPRPIRLLVPSIPSVVEMIINKALQKEPEKRYQSAGLLCEHLKKVISRIDQVLQKKRPKES
ncbi:MAG: CHASE2 domain-containing protein [Deltaproteobacteria bacterium]|nr:CHASE2 domain-containing protein [Deltaproteobacteria bacterium]